jgi:hypothetical protein
MTVRRPTAVAVSFGMWLAAAGVLLLVSVLMGLKIVTVEDALRAIIEHDYPAESVDIRERVTELVALVLVGGGAVLAAAMAGFGTMLHAGRGGARFALAALVVLAAVHAHLARAVAPTIAAAVLPVGIVIAIAASVAMLLPGTYGWFARNRR